MRGAHEFKSAFCLVLILAGWNVDAHGQSDQRQTAIALEQQGKNEEARAIWQIISHEQPSNPEPFAHLGLLEAREEHYAQAVQFYRKALAIAPEMPGLRLNLGLSLFKNGDYKQALQIFDPLITAQPDDQRLNVLVGMSHYGLAEYAAAAPFLKRAAAHDDQNLALLLTLAHSCLLSHQYQCVQGAFHQIVSLDAESAEADMLMGEALDEMKDPEGAIREFRAAVQANPKEPNAHFGLGYLLWTKGQYPDASREFQTEIDNDPNHAQAILYLADSCIQMNRSEEAMPLLEKLLKINIGTSMVHRDLGIVYAEQGRRQDALAEFQTAIRIAPGDVNAHWRLGRLYRSMGMTAQAKAELDKADSLNKAEDERLLKVMSTIPGSDHKTSADKNSPTN